MKVSFQEIEEVLGKLQENEKVKLFIKNLEVVMDEDTSKIYIELREKAEQNCAIALCKEKELEKRLSEIQFNKEEIEEQFRKIIEQKR